MVILSKMFFVGNPCFISPFPSIYPYIPLTAENRVAAPLSYYAIVLIEYIKCLLLLRW